MEPLLKDMLDFKHLMKLGIAIQFIYDNFDDVYLSR